MPRYARFHVTGGLFHVISRFHDRRFYLDIDGARERYLELIGRATETHDARIIAYCLMSSHVHLVLQLGNDSLGKLTKKINSPFANWVNAKRGGIGFIMADRPKSVLVHSETHGVELIRYVHNNPVRAGVVERASESGWSSHRAYLGLEESPSWLATEAVLGNNVNEHEAIRHALACFVDEGRTEGRRPEFNGEVSGRLTKRLRKLMGGEVELSYPVLGPDDFVVSALKGQAERQQTRRRVDTDKIDVDIIVRAVFEGLGEDAGLARQRVKVSKVARGRAIVAWIWVECLGWSQASVADGLGVRPHTVSMMLSKLRREGLSKTELRLVNEVIASLSIERNGANDKVSGTDPKAPKVLVLKRRR